MGEGTGPRAAGPKHPYGAAADARSGERSLPERFRRHADALVRDGRSPLSAALMYAAADDLEAGGTLAPLFEPVPTPPGSVPQLRLLGALHHLVLDGRAPELAEFYPSAGGTGEPPEAWPAARTTIERHFHRIQGRLRHTVQTNEPGRSTVLYAALLWLTERYGLPVRLLEIGASAGLNLQCDQYAYRVAGAALGDAESPVRFHEPWKSGPPLDAPAAAAALQITHRAGCDHHPLDAAIAEDRTTLLSYVWPDELERFERSVAALELAAAGPVAVQPAEAGEWLPGALRTRGADELTVIWQSVFRQYVPPPAWQAIEDAVGDAIAARPEARVAWLMMEPGEDHLARMRLSLHGHPDEHEQLLAWCGDHGPPVEWVA